MKRFHLAIAADWEYDRDFIKLVEHFAYNRGLTTYVIWPENLDETIDRLKSGEIEFRFFFDRASDTSPEFLILHKLMLQKHIPVLDIWTMLKWAADKANMHLKFEESLINTPFTLILPPWQTQPNITLSDEDLNKLGTPFIVKPASISGGGIGVVKNARSLQDIFKVRQTFPDEKYLIQKKIFPKEEDGRRFWFRGFYTCGLIQVVWWNDLTYSYHVLTRDEIEQYRLLSLFRTVHRIAHACELNFFSTEVTIDAAGEVIVIDYVNEVCDMRLKSKIFDGVPDNVVKKIAERIVDYVAEKSTGFVYV